MYRVWPWVNLSKGAKRTSKDGAPTHLVWLHSPYNEVSSKYYFRKKKILFLEICVCYLRDEEAVEAIF